MCAPRRVAGFVVNFADGYVPQFSDGKNAEIQWRNMYFHTEKNCLKMTSIRVNHDERKFYSCIYDKENFGNIRFLKNSVHGIEVFGPDHQNFETAKILTKT